MIFCNQQRTSLALALSLLFVAGEAAAAYQMQVPVGPAPVVTAPVVPPVAVTEAYLRLYISGGESYGFSVSGRQKTADCSTSPWTTNGSLAAVGLYAPTTPPPYNAPLTSTPTGNYWASSGGGGGMNMDIYGDPHIINPNDSTNYGDGQGMVLCIPGTNAEIDAIVNGDVNPVFDNVLTGTGDPAYPGLSSTVDGGGFIFSHMPLTLGGTTWHLYIFSYRISTWPNAGGNGTRMVMSTTDQPATLSETVYWNGGASQATVTYPKFW